MTSNMQMTWRVVNLLVLLGICSSWSLAQLPSALIVIKGQIYQQLEAAAQLEGLQADLHIPGYGEFMTDASGTFEIKLPHRSENVEVNVLPPSEFYIIQPRAGHIILEGLPVRDTTINIQIIVLRMTSSEEQARIELVEKQLQKVEAAQQLTKRQLNQMNKAMTDTVRHFARLRKTLQTQIQRLSDSVSASEGALDRQGSEHRLEMLKTEQRLHRLDDSLQLTLGDLSSALEKKYLRQKEQFRQITHNLSSFSSLAGDMRDYLDRYETIFRSQEFSTHFSALIQDYNTIYEKINSERDEHLEAVQHYWNDASLTHAVTHLYDMALIDIHRDCILHLNDKNEALGIWSQASLGRRANVKKGKASASASAHKLSDILHDFNQRYDVFIEKLSIF